VRWKTANAYLWLGNQLRLVPAGLALVTTVLLLVVAGLGRFAAGEVLTIVLGGIATTAISYLLALKQARFALAAKAAWHAVYQKQRLDAVKLIEELERSSRKGVAGLGDRVARALQIIRDQQR